MNLFVTSLSHTRVNTLGALVLAVTLLTISGCQSSSSEAGTAPDEQSSSSAGEIEAIPVETMNVSPTTFRESFTVPGTTEPVETVQASVEQPGKVVDAPFEEGEEVEAGDLMVRVGTEVDQLRIERLENALESAKREFERTKKLREDDLATPQELDQARTSYQDAKIQLRQARASLDQKTTHSPRAGHIIRKFVEPGEYVSPGQPVATIADISTIEIKAAVPASRLEAARKGAEIEVEIPAIEETFTGKVARLPLEVSADTRTYPVEIHVDNTEGEIRPGMRATTTFTQKVWKDAVVIPRTTVLQGYDRKEIAVITDSQSGPRAEIRPVVVGPGHGNRLVITDGLSSGERLVVRGHRSLMDQAPVNIVDQYDGLEAALDSGL